MPGGDVALGWKFTLKCLRQGWCIYSSNKGNVPEHWLVNPKRQKNRVFLDSRVINTLKRMAVIRSENLGLTIRHTLVKRGNA